MTRIVVIGGGLAGGLFAYRLQQVRADVEITLIERGSTLGGTHTWCFFESDLTAAQRAWIAPFVVHSWPGHSVRFPSFARDLALGYNAITSKRFDRVCRNALGSSCLFDTKVERFDGCSVTLDDGRVLEADAVIDAHGSKDLSALDLAWQKFVGLEVRLAEPHGLKNPLLMDATVAQIDGYRFLYVLPFSEDRLLIEDTRYSNSWELDRSKVRQSVRDYAHARHWRIQETLYEESGVLPIALGGDIELFWSDNPSVARLGMRAGLFHPTTGYSLPETVRSIDRLIALDNLAGPELWYAARDAAKQNWRSQRYFRMLNRMLFGAAVPAERYRVFEHFYRLPEPLISRFFAGQSNVADRLRILVGRPPVPVGAAIKALMERPA